jgi:Right handed beta helix region
MRTRLLRKCGGIGISFAVLAASLHAEGARIVEAPGLPPFTNLQEAVDAANDGDTILVAGGSYDGFRIDGKALHVIAAPGKQVSIQGTIGIFNLRLDQEVLVSGLVVYGVNHSQTLKPALEIASALGHVRVDGCKIYGSQPSTIPGVVHGGDGVRVFASTQVVFAHSSMRGGDGWGDPFGGAGGHGLQLQFSMAALDQCLVEGGNGGNANPEFAGGTGGTGCIVTGNSWMLAAGSSFRGGKGGDCFSFFSAAYAGDGGNGLFMAGYAKLLDNEYVGGAAGTATGNPGHNGERGQGLVSPGTAIQYAGEARELWTHQLVFDSTTFTVNVTGLPGDQVWLRVSTQPDFQTQIPLAGIWAVQNTHVPLRPSGVIPASGSLTLDVPAPELSSEADRVLYLQGFGLDAEGVAWIGSPMHLLVLDSDAPPDCNQNHYSDLFDVLAGISTDCGPNLVPDECDPDCNENGVPDDCDVQTGTCADCNKNWIPDRCDLAQGTSQDCNDNEIPDECDIAFGTSFDQNGNGIPDECESHSIWWVDAHAPAGGNGSASAPFQTLTQAMSPAIDGDEIVLRDGLYTGAGNRGVAFGARLVTVRSENGPIGCVLDLEHRDRAFLIDGGPVAGARIEGLTIVNGAADGGGAIWASTAHAVIRNCVFRDCQSSTAGGAILIDSGSGVIEDCTFVGNRTPTLDPETQVGGAIFFTYKNGSGSKLRGSISRCGFHGNSAGSGGALEVLALIPLFVSHCTFERNRAAESGGAVTLRSLWEAGGTLILDDCLFAQNLAGRMGGGLFVASSNPLYATSVRACASTFVGNQAGIEGGAIAVHYISFSRMENCIAWGNRAFRGAQIALNARDFAWIGGPNLHVERSDVEGGKAGVHLTGGGIVWVAGNLEVDPRFADPDGPDNNPLTVVDNDYRPIAGSPVNDAGDNALMPPDVNDIDGDGNTLEPTPLDLDLTRRFVEDLLASNVGAGTPPLVDMGCYEHP